MGQFSEFGDKYSGGLGTYTANHVPMAIFAPEVKKTFAYGGTTSKDEKHLLIMVSYYDHQKKVGVNDPHDNASISLDEKETGKSEIIVNSKHFFKQQ